MVAADDAVDRRALLRLGLAGVVAGLPACRGAAAARADGIPTRQLGVITGNDPKLMTDWQRWLGRPEDHDVLYFDQRSWAALDGSVDFGLGLAHGRLAAGHRVQWSVPVGGSQGYAAAASGAHDATFLRIARGIVAATPEGLGRICVRLPWEFNLPFQSLAARNAVGRWDAGGYVAAYRHMAGLFRRVSGRFFFDWCPAIGRGGLDPETCYPGDDLVDVVSVDVYYQAKYAGSGNGDGGAAAFYYYKGQPFGLDWLAGFGRRHGKLIGLSEWGVDSDGATAFMRLITEWITTQGTALSHHNYWDRGDGGIDARLSDGHLSAVGAIYRRAFGRG